MEKTRKKPKELLPYGMLLTRLFKHVVSVFPELAIDHYLSHDRVMHPLTPHYERKMRLDHGKKKPHDTNASSSSTTLNHPSLTLQLDDIVDENDEESFHSNSSSPSQNISSLSNVVSRVSLRRHLEEIHVTWALFWKKRDKSTTLHKRRLEESLTKGGDNVRNTCDAVWIIKRSRQRICDCVWTVAVIRNPKKIRCVMGCSFHGLRSEDLNQHLKDFLKLVDSLDLNGDNRERTRLRLFQFSLRYQASNWLERLLAGSISTWEDLTNCFLAQFFSPGRTSKLRNDILMFQQHQGQSHHKMNHRSSGLCYNDPKDFAKPFKAISMPQDVPSISGRRLIELKNQVQCLMEAHVAPNQPIQVNKITFSCDICSGPHDTQYCMENPDLEGLVSNFIASEDAKITRFEADFKQHQSEITNKLDTQLKEFNDRMTGALPNDTVKNPKLTPNSTSSTHSYPTGDPQSSSNSFKSVNAIQTCFKSTTNISKDQPQVNTLTINEIETPKPKEPKESLKDEFADLHLNLPVLEVLAHVPIYDALLDKYIVSLKLGKNGIDVLGLSNGTKSYPIGILKNVEINVGKLKLFEDFHVVDMEREPTCPLLVGRGFLATANAIIDCKRESYKPRTSEDDIGPRPPYFAKRDFRDNHLPGEWEIARDAEVNPFKDILVFRKMVEFLGTIPINLRRNMWESEEVINYKMDWDRPPKEGDGVWHIKIELIDPDGENFDRAFQSIPTTRKLSPKENPSDILNLDYFHHS
ncbi:MAK10-like protein [Tanacetum coccineum]|uniref:MAK10-like protein n=1 Tax=Tanacetum coccineum TaxID=301880 RepID=A0ABQ5J8I8_9ASTR